MYNMFDEGLEFPTPVPVFAVGVNYFSCLGGRNYVVKREKSYEGSKIVLSAECAVYVEKYGLRSCPFWLFGIYAPVREKLVNSMVYKLAPGAVHWEFYSEVEYKKRGRLLTASSINVAVSEAFLVGKIPPRLASRVCS